MDVQEGNVEEKDETGDEKRWFGIFFYDNPFTSVSFPETLRMEGKALLTPSQPPCCQALPEKAFSESVDFGEGNLEKKTGDEKKRLSGFWTRTPTLLLPLSRVQKWFGEYY